MGDRVQGAGCGVQVGQKMDVFNALASIIQQEKTKGSITTETVALLFKPAPCPLSPAPFMIVMEFP